MTNKIKFTIILIAFTLAVSTKVFCEEAGSNPAGASLVISDKIDELKFKDIEISDVLNFISKRSGLNIIAGQNITGKVSIYLRNINVKDALRIILESNGLAFAQEGNIIRVMNEADYEAMYGHKFNDKVQTKIITLNHAYPNNVVGFLDQFKSQVGKVLVEGASNSIIIMDTPDKINIMTEMLDKIDTPLESKVFALNYVKAEDMITKLNEMLTPTVGKLRIDAQSNKIIITDIPQKIKDIAKLFEAFDVREKQVLIEAKIVQVILKDEFQMGINWEAVIEKYKGLDFKNNLQIFNSTNNTSKVAIGNLDKDHFTAMIQALQSVGKTRILSNPHITTTNNKEAKILVGTNQPYATSSIVSPGNGPVTTSENVTFIDVGVKLYVTPVIHNDGFITMKIRPEVSTVSSTITTSEGNQIPVVDTSQVETNIIVKDGVTIILGGMIKNEKSLNINKIPILGDIPFLGSFFQTKDNLKQRTELVVFLTPKIITGDTLIDPDKTGAESKELHE
jgi:type IV pilus assembly protein PilQ